MWADADRRDLLRRVSEHAVLWLIWLHTPLLLLGSRIARYSFLAAIVVWAMLAAAGTVWPDSRSTGVRRSSSAAALWALVALIVLETTGQQWRTDTCLSFFALLGIAAALQDHKAVYISAGLVALHNVVLEHVLPEPGALATPDPWQPFVLLFEAIATTWVLTRATRAITAAETASGIARQPWLRCPSWWPRWRLLHKFGPAA